MADNFFDLPKSMQHSLLIGAESQLRTRAVILEKDIWLCWMLQELFTLPSTMTFKGGTSLSKVYGLINRFSEDIDITIDYRHFSPETDLSKSISKTALKNLSDLKADLKQYVQNNILLHLQKSLKNSLTKSLAKESVYFLSQLKEVLIPLLTYDFVKNNKKLHQRILQLNYWINQLKHNIDLYILDNEGDEFPESFAVCMSSFLLGNDFIEKPRNKDDLIELIEHS